MNGIAKFAVQNIRVTYLIIFILLGLGSLSLQHMPKAEDPQFELPISLVQVFAPGLSPLDIESQVINPLESAFRLLENLKSIEAIIKNGVATFEIRFAYGTHPDDSFDDIVSAANSVKNTLPKQLSFRFIKASPTTVNVLQVALSSNESGYLALNREAKRLQKRLESIAVVNKVELWAAPQQIVQIDIDMPKLLNLGLSLESVQAALAYRGNPENAGYIDTNEQRYSVQLSGKFNSLDEIRNTVIPHLAGDGVKVSDIARVYFYNYQANYLAYIDETPSVFVTVQQQAGANVYQVQQEVDKHLEKFQQSINPQIQVTKLFEQSESVKYRVGTFLDNLWFGLGLILISLFLFIGFKEAVIVALAIPLSIFTALFILDLLGFSFQQMTIAGLIISLGLLVDNALVVVEASSKRLNEKGDLHESVFNAVKEVGWPITSGTLTTLFAFVPLLLLQSDTGDFMRGLPASVSLVLLASLITALLIIPALLINWKVKAGKHFNLQSLMEKTAKNIYQPLLTRSLKLPWISLLLGIGLAAFFASYFPKVGVSLFPKAEKNIIVVNVETPVNASIAHTRKVAFELSEKLSKIPNVKKVVKNIGASNPRIYYNQISRVGETNFAQILLFMDEYDAEKIEQQVKYIRQNYSNLPDAKVNVYEFQQGPVTDRPITVRIIGDDLVKMKQYSDDLFQYLHSLEGTSEVQNESNKISSKLKLNIDEYAMSRHGISLKQVEDKLKSLVNGKTVSQYYDDLGEQYAIIVKPSTMDVGELLHDIQISNADGVLIPMSSFAKVDVEQASAPFYHYQKMRMMKVSADYLTGYNVQSLTQQMIQYLSEQEWQDGIYYEIGGEEAARQESFGGMSQIMLVAFGAIFTILVIQFKSYIQPIIIFSIMPVSVTGAIFGLYLTGNSFSMLAFIGMISLLGIVVNDSIIMVDSFNRYFAQGLEKKDAMVKAATNRFTPIVFTSLTTILGLLPLTLYGGPLWEPMGWVIVTGLIFSTMTCLFFVPSVCLYLSSHKRLKD